MPHWGRSHFLPAGAGNLRFSRFPAEFVGKKSFQLSRKPTNSAGNVGFLLLPAGSVNDPYYLYDNFLDSIHHLKNPWQLAPLSTVEGIGVGYLQLL